MESISSTVVSLEKPNPYSCMCIYYNNFSLTHNQFKNLVKMSQAKSLAKEGPFLMKSNYDLHLSLFLRVNTCSITLTRLESSLSSFLQGE
jgi:hypothetical protein